MDKVTCFVCMTELDNWQYRDVEVHPMRGLHFRSHGHYGSTVFDPMDGSHLDIVICDSCIMVRKDFVYGSGTI